MMKGFTGVFLVLGLILGAWRWVFSAPGYLMETPLLATKEKHKVEFAAPEEGKPVPDSEWEDPVTRKLVQLDPPIPGLDVFGPPAGVLGGTGVACLGIFGILLWRSRKPAPPQD